MMKASAPALVRKGVVGWIVLLVLAALALPGWVWAQSPAPLEHPNLDLRINGQINAIVRQPDGGVIVGGGFSYVDGVPRQNIARLMPDGAVDLAWDPPVNGSVIALAVDVSGDVYVGGDFTQIGGQLRSRIAKLSGSDGTVDLNWNPSANSQVDALAVDADGAVFVGGWFTQISGQSRNYIAKLSGVDGAVAPGWNPSVDSGIDGLSTSGSSVYVLGPYLMQVDGQPRKSIAKLSGSDGALDPDWDPLSNGVVQVLAVDADGAVYVGGDFTQIGGQPRNGIAKLSGTGDGAANSEWSPEINDWVTALALDGNGAVYVGTWSLPGGGVSHTITKLSSSGAGDADPDWIPPSGEGVPLALLVDGASGKVFSGGTFTEINGQPRIGFACLDTDGSVQAARDVVKAGKVHALAYQPGGGVIVGGEFDVANSQARKNLLRLHADGTLDPNWNPSPNFWVEAVAVDSSGAVYVGGAFNHIGGQPRNNIVKLSGTDGTVDPEWNPLVNWSTDVRVLAVDADGTVYLGGAFTQIGDQSRNYIAKISADGSLDLSWNPTANNHVASLALDGNGSIYVAGWFTEIGGESRHHIAKLSTSGSGAADETWNPSANGNVLTLAVDATGAVYAGGQFNQIGSQQVRYVAKLSGDGNGAVDLGWNPSPNSPVNTLAVDGSGAVFVGGTFTQISGQQRLSIAKLTGSDAAADPGWNPPVYGPPYTVCTMCSNVRALAIDTDGAALYVGGELTQVGNQRRLGLAALSTETPPTADLSALIPSEGSLSPAFDPETLNYNLTVPASTESIRFAPTAVEGDAEIRVNGELTPGGAQSLPIPLAVGINPISIVVTVPGVAPREYRVDVLRQSTEPVELLLNIERLPAAFAKGSAELHRYRISVINAGNQMASGVQLNVPVPVGLHDVLWDVTAPAGVAVNPSDEGENAVAISFDLGGGQTLHVDLHGYADAGVAFVDIAAQASAASAGVSTSASHSESANGIGVLKDGFEP